MSSPASTRTSQSTSGLSNWVRPMKTPASFRSKSTLKVLPTFAAFSSALMPGLQRHDFLYAAALHLLGDVVLHVVGVGVFLVAVCEAAQAGRSGFRPPSPASPGGLLRSLPGIRRSASSVSRCRASVDRMSASSLAVFSRVMPRRMFLSTWSAPCCSGMSR